MSTNFSSETTEARGNGSTFFKCLKKMNCQLKILYWWKQPSGIKGIYSQMKKRYEDLLLTELPLKIAKERFTNKRENKEKEKPGPFRKEETNNGICKSRSKHNRLSFLWVSLIMFYGCSRSYNNIWYDAQCRKKSRQFYVKSHEVKELKWKSGFYTSHKTVIHGHQ